VHRVASAFGRAVGVAMTRTVEQTTVSAPQARAYAALPWRMSGEGAMEVLLLCVRRDGRWGIPQGAHSAARTGLRSAGRAAFHEAGVTGRLGPEPVGRYRMIRDLACGRTESCEVTVFGLHVWGTLISWPRDGKVLRRWMDLDEARKSVAVPGLAAVLSSLERLSVALAMWRKATLRWLLLLQEQLGSAHVDLASLHAPQRGAPAQIRTLTRTPPDPLAQRPGSPG
jgi:hypothetical protein